MKSTRDLSGTAILLEPCTGTFAENYQRSAFDANLPIMGFSTKNILVELERLKSNGVILRPDLNRPDWGIENVFEDGCGNLLMLEEYKTQ